MKKPEETLIRRDSLSVADLADILFRQKFLIAFGVLTVCVATVAYMKLSPSRYHSEMLLLLKNNRPEPVLTTDRAVGLAVPSPVTEAQLATEVQLLSDKDVFQEVARRTDANPAVLQKAVARLERQIRIKPGIKSNLISVSYFGDTPQHAVAVLNTLAEVYLNRHLQIHSVSSSYAFFGEQATAFATKLRAAQTKLSDFQRRNDVVMLEQQKDLKTRKLVDLEASLRETSATRNEAQGRNSTLRQQMTGTAARVTTQSRVVPNQYSTERLNTMLVELKNKRTEMLVKFRPEDRLVLELDQRVIQTQAALDSALKTNAKEESTDLNPLRQGMESELMQSESKVSGLVARADLLKSHVSQYRGELDRLARATTTNDELVRSVKELEAQYLLYSRQFEENRIASAMDSQRMANVVIAQHPTVPSVAETKLDANVISASVLGIMVTLGIALLRGMRRREVFTPWELEGIIGMPVLGTVPTTHQSEILLVASRERLAIEAAV